MDTIRDIVEFKSSRFVPVLPEDCQVNPGVYGAELAFWLSQALAKAGVATSYPNNEDWGWFDVPPVLSSTANWSPIPPDQEIGREEALFRRTDHRLPA